MKKILLFLFFSLSLVAGQIRFDDIETTLLKKSDRSPVNVELSLVLRGRDIEESEIELMDTVQTAIGSFWAETIVTSQGKEQFKKMIVDLADRKYGIEVDSVYILNVRIETDTLEKCFELLKKIPGKF